MKWLVVWWCSSGAQWNTKITTRLPAMISTVRKRMTTTSSTQVSSLWEYPTAPSRQNGGEPLWFTSEEEFMFGLEKGRGAASAQRSGHPVTQVSILIMKLPIASSDPKTKLCLLFFLNQHLFPLTEPVFKKQLFISVCKSTARLYDCCCFCCCWM